MRKRNEKAFRMFACFSCCQQIGHNLFSPQSLLFLLLLLSTHFSSVSLWVFESFNERVKEFKGIWKTFMAKNRKTEWNTNPPFQMNLSNSLLLLRKWNSSSNLKCRLIPALFLALIIPSFFTFFQTEVNGMQAAQMLFYEDPSDRCSCDQHLSLQRERWTMSKTRPVINMQCVFFCVCVISFSHLVFCGYKKRKKA